MIVPMTKLTMICLSQDRDRTLAELTSLGVMHISSLRVAEGETLERTRRHLWQIQRALRELPRTTERPPSDMDPQECVDAIWAVIKRRRVLQEDLAKLHAERERIAPFGRFDPEQIRFLAEHGIVVKLYALSPRDEFKAPEDAVVAEIHHDRKKRCVAVIRMGPLDLPYREEPPPRHALDQINADIREAEQGLGALQAEIDRVAGDNMRVADHMRKVRQQVRQMEAKMGMGRSGPVAYLRGFVPTESIPEIERAAERQGWALLTQQPGPGDKAPTLIRNPQWVRPIELIFQFINIAPGYREVDISTLFLLFFSLFFAMIVGDAGYGALFLAFTLAGRRLLPKAPLLLWRLLLIMSIGTIVWGLLTGNVFGLPQLPAALESLKVPWLLDENNLMSLCFLLGAVHLTLAHGWNVIRTLNRTTALAQVGWICTTWVMYFTAQTMVLGKPFPNAMLWVLVIGILLIVVFMTPVRRLKAEWYNHVMFPLNLISNFVDIVSYVRLFAVGMATFAMASAFNAMAGDMAHGVIGSIVAALVLFGGHALNILLATMGVLVHGIRLNTLEFSGHLGLEWTGVPYQPLARDPKLEPNPSSP